MCLPFVPTEDCDLPRERPMSFAPGAVVNTVLPTTGVMHTPRDCRIFSVPYETWAVPTSADSVAEPATC